VLVVVEEAGGVVVDLQDVAAVNRDMAGEIVVARLELEVEKVCFR
jgi:hypothetical protein